MIILSEQIGLEVVGVAMPLSDSSFVRVALDARVEPVLGFVRSKGVGVWSQVSPCGQWLLFSVSGAAAALGVEFRGCLRREPPGVNYQPTWLCTERPVIVGKIDLLLFLSLSSENYLVRWSSSGLPKDIDRLHNLRAVFTVSASGDVG